jgi:hypothetical protein
MDTTLLESDFPKYYHADCVKSGLPLLYPTILLKNEVRPAKKYSWKKWEKNKSPYQFLEKENGVPIFQLSPNRKSRTNFANKKNPCQFLKVVFFKKLLLEIGFFFVPKSFSRTKKEAQNTTKIKIGIGRWVNECA